MDKKLTLMCGHCKKSFRRFACWGTKNSRSGRVFCSRACAVKGKKRRNRTLVSVTCESCGETKQYRKGGEPERFCSRHCTHIGLRGNNYRKPRGMQHWLWSRAVVSRDMKCMRCERDTVALQAHHIKPYADHPELRYDVNNGETLCVDCHTKEHPQLDYLIRSRGKHPAFIKLCSVCSNKFLCINRKQIHCSRKCSVFAKRIESGALMQCELCAEEFLMKPSRRRGERKFCSRRCSQLWLAATQGGRREWL